MKYTLLVLSAPDSGSGNLAANRFASALADAGHELYRVFFLDRGTATGLGTTTLPQDELDVAGLWSTLAQAQGVELVLCVSSALRQGVLDNAEAERYDKPAATLRQGFTLGGLGLLVEALAESDRVLTFGG